MMKKTGKLSLILVSVFCAMVLSGAGYPNDNTVIIGPDVREDVSPLYDVHLEIPKQISKGEEFTARVSLESADNFTVSSEATMSVTGGTLENGQTQALSPDAVWKIRSTSSSLVGVVVSVQTKMSPKDKPESETSYLDTLSGSVDVLDSSQLAQTNNNNETFGKAFQVSRARYIWTGLAVLFVVAIVVVVFFRKKH